MGTRRLGEVLSSPGPPCTRIHMYTHVCTPHDVQADRHTCARTHRPSPCPQTHASAHTHVLSQVHPLLHPLCCASGVPPSLPFPPSPRWGQTPEGLPAASLATQPALTLPSPPVHPQGTRGGCSPACALCSGTSLQCQPSIALGTLGPGPPSRKPMTSPATWSTNSAAWPGPT